VSGSSVLLVCNSLLDLGVLGGSYLESLRSERGDSGDVCTGSGFSGNRFQGVLGSTWSTGGLALSSGKVPIPNLVLFCLYCLCYPLSRSFVGSGTWFTVNF
jgi:hypothetical protein